MTPSFFFYDLETSGLKASEARIMQFAGQRTDMELKPIGDPVNVLIKLTPDVLPDPDAVLLTGITPQQTIKGGITEEAFLSLFYKTIAIPNTVFVGFNNVRFDDEFLRYLNYRNFYDPYAWSWQNGQSRWDILDLVRMTRALRPEGISWPFNNNKPINRLEELTKANNLVHDSAHDALSDVQATIAVAQLIKTKQPKLFEYLFNLRTKVKVAELIRNNEQLVYTSSHFPSEFLHTTIVTPVLFHEERDAAIVYDLRHDPKTYLSMSPEELVAAWQYNPDPEILRLPLKTLKYNRVPAISPISVVDQEAAQRLSLDLSLVKRNYEILQLSKTDFVKRLNEALSVMDKSREDKRVALDLGVDQDLYGGFIGNTDRNLFPSVHDSSPDDLDSFRLKFHDKRLKRLLPLYKARNFTDSLNDSELKGWKDFCREQLNDAKTDRYRERVHELYALNPTAKRRAVLDQLIEYLEEVS